MGTATREQYPSHQPSNKMSFVTQQLLLQAKSDFSDIQRRIANGDDTPKIHDLLTGMKKRIAGYEKEIADAQTQQKLAQESKDKKAAGGDRRDERAPKKERAALPDDLDLPCSDCTNSFTFTGKDQIYFQRNNWNAPLRCPDCRLAKQEKKNAKPKGSTITCAKCSNGFFFSDAKAQVFKEKNYPNPKWCVSCRGERKAAFASAAQSTAEATTEEAATEEAV
jgi:hypothetical protein